MFALLAALVFFIDLIFKPHSSVNLVVVGLLLIALHLAVGDMLPMWRRGPRP